MKYVILAVLTIGIIATPPARAQVSYDRLVKSDSEPRNWLTYSGNYAGHRFSALSRLTASNVGGLRAAWVYQIDGRGRFETTPVVVDGVMYVTEPPTRVTALDARTGRPLWSWQRSLPEKLVMLGFGPTNRGVAVLDNSVFVGTLDCHLVALDAKSGPYDGTLRLRATSLDIPSQWLRSLSRGR